MRSHALTSLMPQTVYIPMSPPMDSGMNHLIWSRSNNWCRFITYVGNFALAVGLPFPLRLAIGAIAVSGKSIYIRGISIMIQLQEAEGSPEATYKVM